jgi:hypothetical protein
LRYALLALGDTWAAALEKTTGEDEGGGRTETEGEEGHMAAGLSRVVDVFEAVLLGHKLSAIATDDVHGVIDAAFDSTDDVHGASTEGLGKPTVPTAVRLFDMDRATAAAALAQVVAAAMAAAAAAAGTHQGFSDHYASLEDARQAMKALRAAAALEAGACRGTRLLAARLQATLDTAVASGSTVIPPFPEDRSPYEEALVLGIVKVLRACTSTSASSLVCLQRLDACVPNLTDAQSAGGSREGTGGRMWTRTGFVLKSLLPLLQAAAGSAVDRYTMSYALEALRLLADGSGTVPTDTGSGGKEVSKEVEAAQVKARYILAKIASENECTRVHSVHGSTADNSLQDGGVQFCMGSGTRRKGRGEATAVVPEVVAVASLDLDQLMQHRWCPRTNTNSEF